MCRVDRLGAAYFLGRLAEELQRSGDALLLHQVLHDQEAPQRAHTKGGVRIGMSTCPRAQVITGALYNVGCLAVARHRIVFGVATKCWSLTIAPGGTEGRGHASRALFDLETMLPQQVNIEPCRTVLAPGGFGIVPDGLVPFGQLGHQRIDALGKGVTLSLRSHSGSS